MPTIVALAITTSPFAPRGYQGGEVIEIWVTFSEGVWLWRTPGTTSRPILRIDVGADLVEAEWQHNEEDGFKRPSLSVGVFRYMVTPDDRDSDGISIGADALDANGTFLRNESGVEADLRIGNHAIVNDGDHLVQGGETSPPLPPDRPDLPRVTERGSDFIVWQWDPVEHATHYEAHHYPVGTSGSPLQTLREPTLRIEGINPEEDYQIYVRAVVETPWGRAVSGWVYTTSSEPLPQPACADMRRIAIGLSMKAVVGWDTTPIRIYVEPAFPDKVREQVAVFARKLDDRLGYLVIDPNVTDDLSTADIQVVYDEGTRSASANNGRTPPAVQMNPSKRQDEIGISFIEHEVGHLFGLGHNTCRSDVQEGWIPMSFKLSCSGKGTDVSDLDNIGCIFPHPAFPR